VTFAGAWQTWEVVMDQRTEMVEGGAHVLWTSCSSACGCRSEVRALSSGWRPAVKRAALAKPVSGAPVAASVTGHEHPLLSVVHRRWHRSGRRARPRRSRSQCGSAFVCGRVVVPDVVRDLHRLMGVDRVFLGWEAR